jgi:DNA-binding response OmpR family regulator
MMPKKKKILLVDDEKAILNILKIKLRISGYDVITAAGGQEALDLIDSALPDIMLLDIIMPGIDGFEVLKKMHTISSLPVIVFSARPENAKKAMSLGAIDFIAKPFDMDLLVNKIKVLLDHHK